MIIDVGKNITVTNAKIIACLDLMIFIILLAFELKN
jgi:hypothetical protein